MESHAEILAQAYRIVRRAYHGMPVSEAEWSECLDRIDFIASELFDDSEEVPLFGGLTEYKRYVTIRDRS